MISSLFLTILVLFFWSHLLFALALWWKRNDIVDVAWGPGFVILGWTAIVHAGEFSLRSLLVMVLVSIWGLRLGFYIYRRNHGAPEDFRYRQWRETWDRHFFLRSYLQIFILQAVLLGLIATPLVFIGQTSSTPLGILDVLGAGIWLVGFTFEAVGDAQLRTFRRNPSKDKIMKTGLWRYTRHPNYFGEVTLWWGIFLIVCAADRGIFTILGPLTITFLILKVSGIPMLEKKYEGNVEFQTYKSKTNAFFPLPPK